RMRDTVLFCEKWKAEHAGAPVARLNGYIRLKDGPVLIARKALKRALALGPVTRALERVIRAAEGIALPDRVLWRMYQLLVGVYMFRGWREGLRLVEAAAGQSSDVAGKDGGRGVSAGTFQGAP